MKFTLVLTLCLVVAVIFLFLRNVSATLIPSLALPISVIGTFAVMYLLDYSLDNLSLMALTLAVGLRGRRRDRDAREHRPPHGDGKAADASGDRRRGGSRVHDHLDDALADRRLHPDPVPGRDRRPAVPRVRGRRSRCRFSCRASCRSRSRRCCRAASCGRTSTTRSTAARTRSPRRGYEWLLGKYERSLDWVMSHRALDDGVLVARFSSAPSCCSCSSRRDSSRARTTASSSSRPKRRRARRSTTWWRTSMQVAAILRAGHEHRRLLLGGRRQLDDLRDEPGPPADRPQAARRARRASTR